MPEDLPPNVDAITATPTKEVVESKKPKVKKVAKLILVILGLPYVLFLLWCITLLAILPDRTGQLNFLIPIGQFSAGVGIGALLVVGALFASRLAQPKVQSAQRTLAALKILVAIIPGIAFAAMVLLSIGKEPSLNITITDPVNPEELIAPIAVTFSAQDSVDILEARGLKALKFAWDYEGDGEVNEQTVEPTVTAVYERSDLYNIILFIQLNDGTQRKVVQRISIPREVFKTSPSKAIIDEPVKFSITHLVDDPEQVKEVQWDFTGDGEPDVVSPELETVYTFVKKGPVPINAIVKYANQSQQVYSKSITIHPPEPLPFPVSMSHEPQNLIGPAPFGTVFNITTEEEISSVEWDFGDGVTKKGEIAPHTFNEKGTFAVVATIRNRAGDIARLTKIVKVVDTLRINDLQFRGSPIVKNKKLFGDLPVEVDLTPVTSLPLITFRWEAPDATEIIQSDSKFKAVYRREGFYNITLLAQDADSKAVRIPLNLEVKPPVSNIVIETSPTGGPAPINITFDASQTTIPGENIIGFEWIFNSDLKDSTYSIRSGRTTEYFEKEGVYKVAVKVLTEQNTYEQFTNVVIRPPVVDPCFKLSKRPTKAPYSVSMLTECTTGKDKIVSYSWDFGDNSQSDLEEPDHLFTEPGTYTIRLSVRTESGTTSSAEPLTITVPE